jgi:hypothetical protein
MASPFDRKEKESRPAWMPPTPVFEETPELGKDREEPPDPKAGQCENQHKPLRVKTGQ